MQTSWTLDPVGDPHNFGRRVAFSNGPAGPIVEKPRTVFWEHMFLDGSSDFRRLLTRLSDKKTDDYIGSISISNSPPYLVGQASNCERNKLASGVWDPKNLEGYGRIISLVTTYGITDLHMENLFRTKCGIQIFDIECVFSSVESPLDSLLVPSRSFNPLCSVFSSLSKLPKISLLENFINGIIAEFNFIKINKDKLIEFHLDRIELYSKIPIRFLIRPSRDYVTSSKSINEFPYLEAELEQMARGDIPYFFGFIGKNELNYYKSPASFEVVEEKLPDHISKKLQRSFIEPYRLLESDRLLRTEKQTIMITLSKIFDARSDFKYSCSNFEFVVVNGLIEFECSEFRLTAKFPEAGGRFVQNEIS